MTEHVLVANMIAKKRLRSVYEEFLEEREKLRTQIRKCKEAIWSYDE